MASEIRVNRLSNRSGLSTITFANGGVQFSGITTFANGDFRVGTGATILNPSTNEMQFHTGGSSRLTINNSGATIAALTATTGTFSSDVSIGGVLTYEDVKNVDAIGIVTARTGVKVTGGDFTVGTAITASSVTGNVTQDVGITTYSGSAVWFKGATANKDMYWSHASGSLVFKDTARILVGDGSDLQIHHTSGNSFIENSTGTFKLRGATVEISNPSAAQMLQCNSGAGVNVYYAGNKKLETTSNGIKVTHTAAAEITLVGANNTDSGIYFNDGANQGGVLYQHNGDYMSFRTAGTDDRLRITSDGTVKVLTTGDNKGLRIHTNGGISATNNELRFNTGQSNGFTFMTNSDGGSSNERFRVNSNGIDVSGDIDLDNGGSAGINFKRNGTLKSDIEIGSSSDQLAIRARGSSGYITFHTNTSTLERLRITSAGDVNIGNAGGTAAHHASGLFNGVTPKFEVKLGAAANSYTRYINIMNPGAQTNSETLGRVGIKLSLGSEASSGESNKSGIIYAESTSGYNNAVSLCFATNGGEKVRITSGGSVNLGSGELTQTARKFNVYGGAARVTQTSGGNTVEIMGNSTSGQSYGLLCSAGTTSGDYISEFRQQNGTTRLRIRGDGNIGVSNGSPFNRFCVGGHTFSGGHGMYANDRVGMSNHGNLTGLMLASTYNDANHPEYGVVFVQGPTTSSYNVWGICPDGPAKGNSLNLHYGAQNTNIHAPTNQKFEFTGEGYFLKPKHPSFLARRSTGGDGRGAASPITEWSTSTTAPCHNTGGHFNASNGKFTAPVAGVYHFSANPGYKQSGNNYNVKFRIDSTDEFEPVRYIDGGDDLVSHSTSTGSITVYLNASQTMSVCIAYTHHVNTNYNFFSGHLIG